jgi:hypothetical protein
VWAIVLIVALALRALEASPDLSTNANAVADLASCHGISDFNCFPDDLVTDTDWQRRLTPASVDGVDIRPADTTTLDLDINVVFSELFGLELRGGIRTISGLFRAGLTSCL